MDLERLRHGRDETRKRLRYSLRVANKAREDSRIERMYVFGRTARCEAEATSDTDFLAVVSGRRSLRSVKEALQKLGDSLNPFRSTDTTRLPGDKSRLFDLTVVTARKFRHPDNSEEGHFIRRVKHHAVPLYERRK